MLWKKFHCIFCCKTTKTQVYSTEVTWADDTIVTYINACLLLKWWMKFLKEYRMMTLFREKTVNDWVVRNAGNYDWKNKRNPSHFCPLSDVLNEFVGVLTYQNNPFTSMVELSFYNTLMKRKGTLRRVQCFFMDCPRVNVCFTMEKNSPWLNMKD